MTDHARDAAERELPLPTPDELAELEALDATFSGWHGPGEDRPSLLEVRRKLFGKLYNLMPKLITAARRAAATAELRAELERVKAEKRFYIAIVSGVEQVLDAGPDVDVIDAVAALRTRAESAEAALAESQARAERAEGQVAELEAAEQRRSEAARQHLDWHGKNIDEAYKSYE